MAKKRSSKTRRGGLTVNGRRSGLEDKFALWLTLNGVKFHYEPVNIPVVYPPKKGYYKPDFVFDKTGKQVKVEKFEDLKGLIVAETKGLLSAANRAKYLLVKQQHPWIDLRFVFQRDNFTTRAKKQRYSEWATQHGFKWYVGETPPKSWFTK